ncbi:amino acid adenylation domain-containing protein [Actinomadura sp. 1N219]|uniref:amino acid adenylation domain-containing protein n=1 Tax=Actinomadura sp. 1N219 TaxID=3375152 RepID=UPI00379EE538
MPGFSVARARRDTPGVANVVHLNNAGASLMPAPVIAAMRAHLDLEASIGAYEAAERAAGAVARGYEGLAELVGCAPSDIALTDSASRAWGMAFSAVPLAPGDRVVTSSVEYGSNHLSMLHAARRHGAVVETVRNDAAGRFDLDALRSALDERVKLIAVAHVPCNGGQVLPVEEIGAVARDAGVPYLVDACQSAGQIPLDVERIQCDFLAGTGRKYLRGPRGTGFLYARPESLGRLSPSSVGLDGARWLGGGEYELAAGARRFETWEADMIARLGLAAAVGYALRTGIDEIWDRVRELASHARAGLREIPGVRLLDQGPDLCGLVSFDVPGREPMEIRERLAGRSVNIWTCLANSACVDMEDRGLTSLLRASVHCYNTTAEIDELCSHLADLVAPRRAPVSRGGDAPVKAVTEGHIVHADPAPTRKLLHGLFEEQVSRTPDGVAVVCGDVSVGFGELDARAGRLARVLAGRGVGAEVLVGVCGARSVELVVALLGVLKAGGAYVPLDPSYPVDRLRHMVADSGVGLVLTCGGVAPAGLGEGVEVLDLDGLDLDEGEPARKAVVRPGNLAYVIYTSGSTGKPKGVAVQHDGIVNNIADLNRRYGVGPGDRLLNLSALSFDMSVYELLGAIAAGAAVVLPGTAAESEPAGWWSLIRRHRVTIWHSVPARLEMLLDAEPDATRESLRVVLSGGDRLPPELAVRVWDRLGEDVELHNLGGVTEASIYSNCHRVEPADAARPSIPYGRAMDGQVLSVLDDEDEAAPPGEPGELCVAGAGLARGYLNDPRRTADRFVPNPLGPPGSRLYRAGDRARWHDAGWIELIGRVDDQIKIAGLRIEPGEIEARLRRIAGVGDAVVVAVGDARLVAYLRAADARPAPGAALIRQILGRDLPSHLIPARYHWVDRLPVTANGKVDRRALAAAPEPARAADATATGEAARSPAERALVGIWREVLGLPDADAASDLFENGGTSLTAGRIAARVRASHGVTPSMAAIFQHPTPRALAAHLDAAASPDGGGVRRATARTLTVPLSPYQERIWYAEQLDVDVPIYNVPLVLALPDGMGTAGVEDALNRLVDRHPSLRARVRVHDGRPLQTIEARPERLRLRETTIEAARLRDAAAGTAHGAFDLVGGPLIRAEVLRVRETGARVLVVVVHHLVCDAWSMDLLVRDLAALCARPGSVPDRPGAVDDYLAFVTGAATDRDLHEAQLDHWDRRLSGAPELTELPADHPHPAIPDHLGDRVHRALDPALADALDRAARRGRTTLFAAMLAAFKIMVCRYTGQGDLVVGTLTTLRDRPELEDVTGYFVNTVAVRTDLSGDPAAADALARVRDEVLAAVAHRDVPFERVVRRLSPRRDPSRSPVFQLMFNLHEQDAAAPLPDAVPRRELEGALGGARYDLTVDVTRRGDRVDVSFEYATAIFEPATAERLADHYLEVLRLLADEPGVRLSEIALSDAGPRSSVLVPDRPRPAGTGSLHGLFEEQVSRTPDGVAVVCGDVSVGFGELDGRAGRLARVLAGRGVGAEVLVGVCGARSVELVVALLGVLKAGGAYVPLDPSYPVDRLRHMVADSGVGLVLTCGGAAAAGLGEGVEVLDLDGLDLDEGEPARKAVVRPGNLAYVIYTSGSTGKPKGVAVQHDQITSFLGWNQAVSRLGPGDRVLQNHSAAFDNSVWEIFQCLVSGAELHLPPPGIEYDAEALVTALDEARITSFNATPSQMRVLMRAAAQVRPDAFRSLRLLFTGAEAVPRDIAAELPAWLDPGCAVYNEYGPTEATVTSAVCRITPELLERHADRPTVPFGRATDNARLYVLDAALRPVPPGCRGELYVGGAAVTRGYLGQGARTAERFRPDPFADGPGARMYQTGDVVRVMPDGNLLFLGRGDGQVKLRGYRIETGEIEAAVRDHPAMRDCAVTVRDVAGSPALACYVVTGDPAARLDPAALLRPYLADRLPVFMVPAVFAAVPELPLTPNGKLDVRALPDPERPRRGASGPGTGPGTGPAPRGELEQAIADVWARALKVDAVAVDANFFDLGGHSLMLAETCLRLGDRIGRRVSPLTVLRYPTVSALAAHLGHRDGRDDPSRRGPRPADRLRRAAGLRLHRNHTAAADGPTHSDGSHR